MSWVASDAVELATSALFLGETSWALLGLRALGLRGLGFRVQGCRAVGVWGLRV